MQRSLRRHRRTVVEVVPHVVVVAVVVQAEEVHHRSQSPSTTTMMNTTKTSRTTSMRKKTRKRMTWKSTSKWTRKNLMTRKKTKKITVPGREDRSRKRWRHLGEDHHRRNPKRDRHGLPEEEDRQEGAEEVPIDGVTGMGTMMMQEDVHGKAVLVRHLARPVAVEDLPHPDAGDVTAGSSRTHVNRKVRRRSSVGCQHCVVTCRTRRPSRRRR
mmetsp:Transcript_46594/g.113503  ORF Transcript_46594/g.113503 Transcript_46594/m.113503 type:complete len:213 (-) Transcript_46594:1408-2046(-)